MKKYTESIKRGDIYYANLSPIIGSEQGGIRPVLILQNDKFIEASPTTIVAAITSKLTKAKMQTHVAITTKGLPMESVVLLEQIRTIDKSRLREKICHLESDIQRKIDRALLISLSLDTYLYRT